MLRNLMIYFESGSRAVLDMLLTAGNEAFQLANMYYKSVHNAARMQLPDAEAVYRMLRLFWKRRSRTSEEPTERAELLVGVPTERDFKRLEHGTADGEIIESAEIRVQSSE